MNYFWSILSLNLKAWHKNNAILGLYFSKTQILLLGPRISHEPNKSILVKIIYAIQYSKSLSITHEGVRPCISHAILSSWCALLLSCPSDKFPLFHQIQSKYNLNWLSPKEMWIHSAYNLLLNIFVWYLIHHALIFVLLNKLHESQRLGLSPLIFANQIALKYLLLEMCKYLLHK